MTTRWHVNTVRRNLTAQEGDDMTGRCTFCTKSAEQVGTLVAGPGVFICDECVDLSASLFAT